MNLIIFIALISSASGFTNCSSVYNAFFQSTCCDAPTKIAECPSECVKAFPSRETQCKDLKDSYFENNCCTPGDAHTQLYCPLGCQPTNNYSLPCTYTAEVVVAPNEVKANGTMAIQFGCRTYPLEDVLPAAAPRCTLSSRVFNATEVNDGRQWESLGALLYTHEAIRYLLTLVGAGITAIHNASDESREAKYDALKEVIFVARWVSHAHSYGEDEVLGKKQSLPIDDTTTLELGPIAEYADGQYASEHTELRGSIDALIDATSARENATALRERFQTIESEYHDHMASEEAGWATARAQSSYADPLFFNALGGLVGLADVMAGSVSFSALNITSDEGYPGLPLPVPGTNPSYLSFYSAFLAVEFDCITRILTPTYAAQGMADFLLDVTDPTNIVPNQLFSILTSDLTHADWWLVRHLRTLFE